MDVGSEKRQESIPDAQIFWIFGHQQPCRYREKIWIYKIEEFIFVCVFLYKKVVQYWSLDSHVFQLFHHSPISFWYFHFWVFYFKSSSPERVLQCFKKQNSFDESLTHKLEHIFLCMVTFSPKWVFLQTFICFYFWKFFNNSNFARIHANVRIYSIFDFANLPEKKLSAKYIVPEMCKVRASDRWQLTLVRAVELTFPPHFVAFFRNKASRFRWLFLRFVSIGSKRWLTRQFSFLSKIEEMGGVNLGIRRNEEKEREEWMDR